MGAVAAGAALRCRILDGGHRRGLCDEAVDQDRWVDSNGMHEVYNGLHQVRGLLWAVLLILLMRARLWLLLTAAAATVLEAADPAVLVAADPAAAAAAVATILEAAFLEAAFLEVVVAAPVGTVARPAAAEVSAANLTAPPACSANTPACSRKGPTGRHDPKSRACSDVFCRPNVRAPRGSRTRCRIHTPSPSGSG